MQFTQDWLAHTSITECIDEQYKRVEFIWFRLSQNSACRTMSRIYHVVLQGPGLACRSTSSPARPDDHRMFFTQSAHKWYTFPHHVAVFCALLQTKCLAYLFSFISVFWYTLPVHLFKGLACGLAGCLVGWLAGWLVGCLAGLQACRLAHWLALGAFLRGSILE